MPNKAQDLVRYWDGRAMLHISGREQMLTGFGVETWRETVHLADLGVDGVMRTGRKETRW